ncbi:hypothetical protein [Kribbella sp. NBC_00359]|uniref:hypothetical protein n=1 Tax=Kribbella sp. NBC_00359 TaxID=2975966 RepID=UPI002E232C2A
MPSLSAPDGFCFAVSSGRQTSQQLTESVHESQPPTSVVSTDGRTGPPEPRAPVAARPHRKSPSRIAFDRLHNKVAITCAAVVLFFVLVAIFAAVLAKIEAQDSSTFKVDPLYL